MGRRERRDKTFMSAVRSPLVMKTGGCAALLMRQAIERRRQRRAHHHLRCLRRLGVAVRIMADQDGVAETG